MNTPFRNEAIAARNAQYLGSIRIGRNPSFALASTAAVVLGVVLLAYASLGEIVRKARLPGLLIPTAGTFGLSVPQGGTLLEISVKEGDVVRANQGLIVVGIDRATTQGDASVLVAQSIEQRRVTLQTERALADLQYRQRQQSNADRTRSTESEARKAESELDGVRRRIQLARKNVDRFTDLARSGFVSEVQVQQKQEDLLDLLGRESAAERSLIGLRRDAQSLRVEHTANASSLQAQVTQLDRSLATLRQEGTENDARRELLVSAPQAGTVTALTVSRGQSVQAGQTLVTIVPLAADGNPSRLEAHLFAPSRAAGFVRPDQTVWIRYAAYPYQKFGMARGTIRSVSHTPISPQDLPQGQSQALLAAAQSVEPMYRINVVLDSQDIRTYGAVQPLKAGLSLEADVVQDKRRIWEWLLEPVLAASGLARHD